MKTTVVSEYLLQLIIIYVNYDDEGRSALHHCCIEGNERAGLSFIMRGAQIDATDNDGLTPLMVACCMGHDNLAAMLLDAGADVGLRDNFGRSPLHHAILSN